MSFYVSSGPLAGSNKLPARPLPVLQRLSTAAIRKPFSVISGSTWSMRSTPLAISAASPPVATTAGRVPSSSSSRARISYTAPDCMASTVLVPMAWAGSCGSMAGRRAVLRSR